MVKMNGTNGATLFELTSPSETGSRSQKINVGSLRLLLDQQEFKCRLTGRLLTPETSSADHIIPIAKGGLNVIDNIQIVCWEANRAKGTMSNEAFIALCKDVAARNP
jgi:5-methylcytosine-specific restriction endonuclease McrA